MGDQKKICFKKISAWWLSETLSHPLEPGLIHQTEHDEHGLHGRCTMDDGQPMVLLWGSPASGVGKSASLPEKSPGQLGQVDPAGTGPKYQNQWALGIPQVSQGDTWKAQN